MPRSLENEVMAQHFYLDYQLAFRVKYIILKAGEPLIKSLATNLMDQPPNNSKQAINENNDFLLENINA